ncbi:hypothetical protein LPJ61_003247 [Coemansia biformis]|uniref:Uncharacterized protein n=1 Tax=Coemansia biformis TaxID=1286918 RepID=A0A9W7YCX5_9FUNG|nr:hypothetical protein LPJ61_003247 [Coemansia biformis]
MDNESLLIKRVRFPEEQRLLETIRLIDPSAAQSIESRAEKNTVPLPLPLPLPEPEPTPASEPEPVPAQVSPPCSPDTFGTASSLLFDETIGHLAVPPYGTMAVAPYVRPPLPPAYAASKDQQAMAEEQRMVRCKGAMIFNRSALSPTLTAMAHGCGGLPSTAEESGEESDGGLSAVYEDAIGDVRELPVPSDSTHHGASGGDQRSLEGLGVLLSRPPQQRVRAMVVGPNVGSAQSSPTPDAPALGPASQCSSSPSPPPGDRLVAGRTDSAHLYPSSVAVFGANTQ